MTTGIDRGIQKRSFQYWISYIVGTLRLWEILHIISQYLIDFKRSNMNSKIISACLVRELISLQSILALTTELPTHYWNMCCLPLLRGMVNKQYAAFMGHTLAGSAGLPDWFPVDLTGFGMKRRVWDMSTESAHESAELKETDATYLFWRRHHQTNRTKKGDKH